MTIENVAVSMQGSDADNVERTLFTSSTPWETNGINLLVHTDGLIQHLGTNYSVVDSNTIQFFSPLATTQTVQFVITRLVNQDEDKVSIDRAAKKIEGKTQTSVNKDIYEENIPSHFIIHTDDIWSTEIPPDPIDAISTGVAMEYDHHILTQDLSVESGKGWYASSDNTIGGRLIDWVPDRFSSNYHIRLYDANNVEIVTSDEMQWKWDYQSGYLFVEYDHEYTTPFKITGYRYMGSFGSEALTAGASHWKAPIPNKLLLPPNGNQEGDTRLVLDEDKIYRWKVAGLYWAPTSFSSARFKDPVAYKSELPLTFNEDGDFRLVLDTNSIWRWNDATQGWEDILNDHDHDDRYYTKSETEAFTEGKADESHVHDTRYYTKYEVDTKVRWRPSVASFSALPQYTENWDGDVILTRDDNLIYRWDPNKGAQGTWVPIVAANLTWKEPVDMVDDLTQFYDMGLGDVHLVLDEGIAYYWDGTQWIQMGIGVHDHNDLYYTESEIDVMIKWKLPSPDYASLPIANNENGDVRLTLNNNRIYKWDGVEWLLITGASSWREPVAQLSDLMSLTMGNIDGDTRVVLASKLIYQWDESSNTWVTLSNPPHDHDILYYTKAQLDGGILDTQYYTESEIDALFDVIEGHDHDGINSKKVDYNNLINIPTFSWKNPVVNFADLPIVGNTAGDAKIVLNDGTAYFWDSTRWAILNEGSFASLIHDHDDLYYRKQDIIDLIANLEQSINIQLAQKADINHYHDDRYYTETEIDELFDPGSGHSHDGVNSRKISFYDLIDIPPAAAHDHDDRYYPREDLQTPGESLVHWENITNKPDLANGHWRSPVQTVTDLPVVGNVLYDIRMILDTNEIYEWDGTQWVYVGTWTSPHVNFWQEPVTSYNDLPLINNQDGYITLVAEENILYRWYEENEIWIELGFNEATSSAQVYLNGIQLTKEVEWIRLKKKAIRTLVPLIPGDKITLIFNGEFYLRQDFIAYAGQDVFEVLTSFHREDVVITQPQTDILLTLPFQMNVNQLVVWLNGLIQIEGLDFHELTPTLIRFVEPLEVNDHVILMIMNQPSGVGEYVREDHHPVTGQSIYTLNNFYNPGTGQLLAYLNGQLLKPGHDYNETSNSTIETEVSATTEDSMTFIIFGLGQSGGCCNAKDVQLGIPSDGTYLDGLLNLFPEMKVNDAVDDINEALLALAPDQPLTLSNRILMPADIDFYSGYVSNGNMFYEYFAGEYHTYLTENTTFTLITPNGDTFGDADVGELVLEVNGTEVDRFDLYGAFVEDAAAAAQSAATYGIQASGARGDTGVVGTNGAIRNSDNGYISIMGVEKYNNFKLWQVGVARVNVFPTILRQGYNTIKFYHELGDGDQVAQEFKLFMDIANSRPTFGPTITCIEQELNSTKYCSGVRYYSIGDVFRSSWNALGVFDNTYSQVPVILDMEGLQEYDIDYDHIDIVGPSSPPTIGNFFSFNGQFTLNEFNEYSINAKLQAISKDPFGIGEIKVTSSVNRLVNTYTNGATDLVEHFRDEMYRLPIGNYDIVPSPRKNIWNSQLSLDSTNALLFDGSLMYADINFLGTYLPAQVVDYSGRTEEQIYIRSFYRPIAKNAGTFIIDGITLNDVITNKIIIDIKLPSKTGWLSMNSYYDITTFTGSDGDGCFINNNGNEFAFSTGTFSTAFSGYMTIVRITLPNSGVPIIGYMELT